MNTENRSHIPPYSPGNEKEAQIELDRLRKRLREHENGAINLNRKLNRKHTGLEGKNLWDWLNLLGVLAIPLVVVGATIGFGLLQIHLADKQHDSDQLIARTQHDSDQQIAQDQQHAAILQTYIDNIQDLLLNHNLLGDFPVPKNSSDKVIIQEVRELARARTLTALQGLDPHRKGVLLKFLYEANLIGYFASSSQEIRAPIINLKDANLTQTDLTGADLAHTDLTGVNLSGALLDNARLIGTDLTGANLTDVTLTDATLTGANLTDVTLTDANLTGAVLANAYLTSANLTNDTFAKANLEGTILDNATLQGVIITQQQLNQTFSCINAELPIGMVCPHRSK